MENSLAGNDELSRESEVALAEEWEVFLALEYNNSRPATLEFIENPQFPELCQTKQAYDTWR